MKTFVKWLCYFTVAIVISTILVVGFYHFSRQDEMDHQVVRESVLSIRDEVFQVRGTAWVTEVNGDRVVITAKHILQNRINSQLWGLPLFGEPLVNEGIKVQGFNGEECYVSIISFDDVADIDNNQWHDWIILSCPCELDNIPALPLAEETPCFGETLIWCGYPDTPYGAVGGEAIMSDYLEDGEMYRMGGVAGLGASGSPVYCTDYGVVGMLTRIYHNTGFAKAINIPMILDEIEEEYLIDLLEQSEVH